MNQNEYFIKTNDKDVTLTVPKSRVTTVGDLKKDIASQLKLANDNMRLFQNQKNFLFGNEVELASVIKDGDQMKAIPEGQKRSMNFGGVSAFQKKPLGTEIGGMGMPGMSGLGGIGGMGGLGETGALDTMRGLGRMGRGEADSINEGESPPQKTQSSFKSMFDQMFPMRQASLSNPMSLFTNMRDNDPISRMSSFFDNFGMRNDFLGGNTNLEELRSTNNQMSDQQKMKYMTHQERNLFIENKYAEEKQRKEKERQERIARGQEVQEEKKLTPYKKPKYVYQKYQQKYLNSEQKYKKAVRRLHELKVPDAEYWAKIGINDQEIAEALYRSKAEYLEPIVHRQMQRHVMKAWLKQIIELDKIKEEHNAFLRQPGVLEYFFGYRLPYPVQPLKILMQNRKEQFVRLIRHWYDVDETEVLPQEEQNKIKESLSKYTDENLVKKLMNLVESQEQARKLVQISQNDLHAAINYYLSGQRSLFKCNFFVTFDVQIRQLPKLMPWEQQIFLYRWLRKYDNYAFTLRMQCEPHFFQIYCLSMRHLCQPLCNLLIKNKPYIDKLMVKFAPPKQEEQRPPKREQEKQYIYLYRM